MPIRILLVDPQALFRGAVKAALQKEDGLDVVAEAADIDDALAAARQTPPDVAILHSELASGTGLELLERLRDEVPGCYFVLVSDHLDVDVAARGLELGAGGYITKEFPLSILVEGVRMVTAGEMLIPGSILGPVLHRLIDAHRGQDEAMRRLSRLSAREKQVLALLSRGANNETIARELYISPQTARTHIQNILSKLELHSRLQAAAFVRQERLLDELARSAD